MLNKQIKLNNIFCEGKGIARKAFKRKGEANNKFSIFIHGDIVQTCEKGTSMLYFID